MSSDFCKILSVSQTTNYAVAREHFSTLVNVSCLFYTIYKITLLPTLRQFCRLRSTIRYDMIVQCTYSAQINAVLVISDTANVTKRLNTVCQLWQKYLRMQNKVHRKQHPRREYFTVLLTAA